MGTGDIPLPQPGDLGRPPPALIYVARGAAVQPVHIKIGSDELILIVEPGHDPEAMWTEFRQFLDREVGIGAARPIA